MMSTTHSKGPSSPVGRIIEERRRSLATMKKELDGLDAALSTLVSAHDQARRHLDSLEANHQLKSSELYRSFAVPSAIQTFLKAKIDTPDIG